MSVPACFGSPVAVSATARTCQACKGAVPCLAAADAFLAKQVATPIILRERLALSVTRQALTRMPVSRDGGEGAAPVVASSRGIKRIALTPAEADYVARLPARVASPVKRLMERGWFDFARTELAVGRNPADKGWMRVLCDKLLAGPVTRADLQLAFQEQLDLSPASAKVQASIGIAVMAAGRLAREFQGFVRLSQD